MPRTHAFQLSSFLPASYSAFLVLLAFSSTMAESNVKAITTGNNELNNKLYHEVSAEKPGENLIMSPISLHTILSLVREGAESKTEDDLTRVLRLPDKTKSAQGYQQIMSDLNNVQNITLELANKVYLMEGYKMKAQFKKVAEESFFAGSENVNFAQNTAAAKTINTWVEEKTNDKIKDLIPADALSADTRMVLVNAIYFKGDWKDKFDEELTTTKKFHVTAKKDVDCQMMFRKGKYFYAEIPELSATAIKLPYKNEDFSLVVILPQEIEGITDLENKIKNYDLTKVTNNMRNIEVEVSLPKFKIETTMDLNNPLKNMGLSNMFSNEANFSSLIDSDEPLKVSQVIQKAFIEVNEKGAEAAAATGILFATFSMPAPPPPPMIFKADHPFLFLIEGATSEKTILFQGKLNEI